MCSLLFNHLQIHNKCIFYEFLNETEKATPNYTVADCRVSNNHFQLMILFFFGGGMLLHFVPWTWWGYYYHYSLIHTLPSYGKATTQGAHPSLRAPWVFIVLPNNFMVTWGNWGTKPAISEPALPPQAQFW